MTPEEVKVRRLSPGEILDAQGDLLERLTSIGDFREMNKLAFSNGIISRDEDEAEEIGLAWVEALESYAKLAYAYRVTEDMCTLLEHAQASLDEEDLFDVELAPTEWGIVYFERPILIHDVRDKTMLVHWCLWGPVYRGGGKATAFAFYNDGYVQPDEVWEDFLEDGQFNGRDIDETTALEVWETARRITGRWNPVNQNIVKTGTPLGGLMLLGPDEQMNALKEKGIESDGATNLTRYMHALFLLLNQTIVDPEEEEADRPARRRVKRRGMPSSKVTVIKLRRHEGARHPGESMVEWSHRWVVRGHWRWQAYGPGRQERRRIWIAPFVKGPDDKPLVATNKLYSLEQ